MSTIPPLPAGPDRAVLRAVLRVVAVAALACVVAACSTPPEPLPRRDVPEHVPGDPAQPCTGAPGTAPATDPAAEAGEPQVRFDSATNTIVLTGGEDVPLPALGAEVADSALHEVEPGVWLLGANIAVQPGASLRVAAPEVRWLRMASGGGDFVSITAYGGGLAVDGTCVTSWVPDAQTVDEDHRTRRSYLLARDGATMTIDNAELRYLGSGDVESYGLSWRTEGTTGHIRGSAISHLYYGLYSYEVDGLEVTDNEFHDNVLYGIDPHTESRNLVIERNVVHHNGKHGIILAEDCVDSVIRDNVVYANKHHGIVMYLHSDRNLIEGNESFDNAAQGININESNENTIRGNKVYDNTESGVSLTQTSRDNVVVDNELRGNGKDGIRLVSEAAETTVRDNTIGRNDRYGVYVDTASGYELTGNTVFGSRIGLMVRGDDAAEGDNEMFGNEKADAYSD